MKPLCACGGRANHVWNDNPICSECLAAIEDDAGQRRVYGVGLGTGLGERPRWDRNIDTPR